MFFSTKANMRRNDVDVGTISATGGSSATLQQFGPIAEEVHVVQVLLVEVLAGTLTTVAVEVIIVVAAR